MTRTGSRIRPPRPAAWLVNLYASADRAESILGDLAEEFSGIVSKSGILLARRWYWRQSAKTIAHLAGAPFRDAPWSLAGVIFFGFLLHWFSATLPERVIVAILRMQRPYSNLRYGFYVWLVTYGIPIVAVTRAMLIGSIVAVLAKGRELVATLTLGIVFALPIRWLLFLLFLRAAPERPVAPFLTSILLGLALNVISTALAGGIVRIGRSSEASPRRVT